MRKAIKRQRVKSVKDDEENEPKRRSKKEIPKNDVISFLGKGELKGSITFKNIFNI